MFVCSLAKQINHSTGSQVTHYSTYITIPPVVPLRIIKGLGGLGTVTSFIQLCFCYLHSQTKLSSHIPVFLVTIFWLVYMPTILTPCKGVNAEAIELNAIT